MTPYTLPYTASDVPDGFHIIGDITKTGACLVKVYNYGGQRFIAYGAWDGGGAYPLSSIHSDCPFTPVAIVPSLAFAVER